MTLLEKKDNLIKAIHKKIPNGKEARVFVNQFYDCSISLINNQANLTLNGLEKIQNENIICDTSYSDDLYKSSVAVAMSKINELCQQFEVDEMFPGITPQSKYVDYHDYLNQYVLECTAQADAYHKEHMKNLN